MESQLKRIPCSTRHVWGVIIIAALFCCQLWGLDPDKPVDQYLVDKWEISDGIPSNTILSITQTRDGYLWIATAKGLVRFDGMHFSTIHFARAAGLEPRENPIPDALFVDREGTLWIGSSLGLTSYRYQSAQFNAFSSADGITRDRIRRIKDDMRGNLWISFFASYVNRFTNGEFTTFNESHGLKGKKINAIVEDQKGNLLFGTRENGVFIYKDGKFLKYPIAGLDRDNIHIINMYEDRKGELWVGTNSGLFRVLDKGTRRYSAGDGLANDYVTHIIEDSDRNLWVGTLKGLNRLKKRQDGTIEFENLLNPFIITCLFEDREKSLWIGTYNSGIKRLKDGKFISYEPLKAHQGEILLSVFEDRHGDAWIGTLGGKLFRCRGSEFIESIEPPAVSGAGITSFVEDAEGNLWLGTNGKGIFQKKNETFVQLTTREGLADNLVTSISRDSQGNLWFSTFDGVSVIRMIPQGNHALESFNSRTGLSGKVVHNVYEDKNQNIWIATDKGITILKDGKIAKENMTHYLPGISVTCIYEDRSAENAEVGERIYWIATHGAGLKRFNLRDGTVISYTTANGMATDFIYQFFEDQQENFWLMSDSGILRVSKKELNRFADGGVDRFNCTSFGVSDGLKSMEFNTEYSRHSAIKTRNGEFWFITKKGISIVNPKKIQINKVPPPVVIEAVFAEEQSIPLHQEVYEFKGVTDLRIHFTAPTFLSPEKIKFKYQLEGFDNEWIFLPWGNERRARYQNLAPGTYTFKVTASNYEGVWNRTGVSMRFTLKSLFHETFFFKVLIILIFILLVAVVFYIYKKQPFKRQEKYKGSPLTPQFADECIKKLTYLMEIEKLYRDADISLQLLAERLSVSPHLLSQILNEKLNRNFSDFVNYYRIEEAKQILASPRGDQLKIIAVAFEVGFNTKVAFYNAFKKYTKMTPSQYREGKK
ncbi:MAG: helix-turn-helix domain-containing protein [Candidatus Aminicenantes bacterium]|nr:helix-turn-helix domain-containing protein [Candidatus Aminicenantes bacterium]NIM79772.1 helix-turn-helix domain-containing protein [Candidatus Aminicenantes bacterium]NIN19100.1 helix-turn-helix domain-containing protein [Candidatus Aminicenantes bacterium]NIN43002.1 helix-turn-helix domain-containing protein [Candidatus Aminicenantes bacterium]NIN85745.1 helix-turn-helix domain-containing protein [Candidatus Aminicenantes bacterium]